MNAENPTKQEIEAEAYELVIKTQSGEIPLDMAKYRKAVEILATSDIKNQYLKLSPRLSDMISEALTKMRKICRDYLYYNHKKMVRTISEKLELNRKLSCYAKDADWAEEMNVAAIFSMCRHHPLLNTKKFFQNNLTAPTFSQESVNMISLYVLAAPDYNAIYRNKDEDIFIWKLRVMDFLEELAKAPVPCILIFCAMEIGVLYEIKHDLEKQNPKVWKHHRHLSQKDQLWFHGKIVDIIGSLSKDNNVVEIMQEYRQVSLKIFKLKEHKNPESAKVKV